MMIFRTQGDLDAALDRLKLLDQRLVKPMDACEPILLRQRPAGLAGLLQIILAQQVSVASARAIWQAFEGAFPSCDPQELALVSEEMLRACKLSRPKIRTVQAISRSIADGFDLDGLAGQDADHAKAALVRLHGVGPWTAEVYLLFCLGVGDVFPAGDLALQVAVQHVLGLEERPSEKVLAALAQELWAPERGAAAHLFWAVYRGLKSGRDGIL